MTFIRKVANSDILSNIKDIPDSLKNKKVEILIFPYEDMNIEGNKDKKRNQKQKKVRGILEKYKNKELQKREKEAWAEAVMEKHENS